MHSCGTSLLDTLAGDFCRTFVGDVCRKLLSDTLMDLMEQS